jgi:hypothetical protein
LVETAVDILEAIVDSTASILSFTRQHRELVAALIEFLTVAVLGPCTKNQRAVISSAVPEACTTLIRKPICLHTDSSS